MVVAVRGTAWVRLAAARVVVRQVTKPDPVMVALVVQEAQATAEVAMKADMVAAVVQEVRAALVAMVEAAATPAVAQGGNAGGSGGNGGSWGQQRRAVVPEDTAGTAEIMVAMAVAMMVNGGGGGGGGHGR